MSLYIVLVNILFSTVLANFVDNGPLLDGFVTSRKPTVRRHSHHRHRNNYHLDQWVIKHLSSDLPEQPNKGYNLSADSKEISNETVDNFLKNLLTRPFNVLRDESEKSREVDELKRSRRHENGGPINENTRVNTIESDVFEVIPTEIPDKDLHKYREQSMCEYTVENVKSKTGIPSRLKHIRCKQTGKLTRSQKERRYCAQTYTYTKLACEDTSAGSAEETIKLYTGCICIIPKPISKEEDVLPIDY